jgi:hypothetical protein
VYSNLTTHRQVREKVTRWCHNHYMRPGDMVFYKANKVGDDKLEHCDHQITSDVDKFAETFASVLSQSLKPIGAQPLHASHSLCRRHSPAACPASLLRAPRASSPASTYLTDPRCSPSPSPEPTKQHRLHRVRVMICHSAAHSLPLR